MSTQIEDTKAPHSDDHIIKKVLTDAALLVAIGTAFLIFLGLRRESSYIESFANFGRPLRPATESLLASGFQVITDLPFHDELGIARYAFRGALMVVIAWVLSQGPAFTRLLFRNFWFWLFIMAACWCLSQAAQRQGAHAGRAHVVDNAAQRNIEIVMQDDTTSVIGTGLYSANGIYALYRRSSHGAEVVYIPEDKIRTVTMTRGTERSDRYSYRVSRVAMLIAALTMFASWLLLRLLRPKLYRLLERSTDSLSS